MYVYIYSINMYKLSQRGLMGPGTWHYSLTLPLSTWDIIASPRHRSACWFVAGKAAGPVAVCCWSLSNRSAWLWFSIWNYLHHFRPWHSLKGLNQRAPKGSERPIVNHTPFPSSLRTYTISPRFYHPGGSSRAGLCTGPWKCFRVIITFPAQIGNNLPGAWAAPFFPMMLAPRQTSGNGRDVLRWWGQPNSDLIWLWLFPRSWWPHVAAACCRRVALGFKKSFKRFLLKVSSWMILDGCQMEKVCSWKEVLAHARI